MEQKPQTSNGEIWRKIYHRETLKREEPSETDERNDAAGFEPSRNFSFLLNENFNRKKKHEMKNRFLKYKQLPEVVPKPPSNGLNIGKIWCNNTPLLVRLMYFRALRKRLQGIVFVHQVNIRWNTPPTVLQQVTNKKHVKKNKPLPLPAKDGNRNTFLDFYTFSVLSTLILGPKIAQPPAADRQTKRGRCKHDVILLVSVLRRMVAENARGQTAWNDSEVD